MKAFMDARKQIGKQPVTRHGKPDARLSILIDEQRRQHAKQRASGYDEPEVIQANRFQRVGDRGRIVQRLPIDDARQHQRDGRI